MMIRLLSCPFPDLDPSSAPLLLSFVTDGFVENLVCKLVSTIVAVKMLPMVDVLFAAIHETFVEAVELIVCDGVAVGSVLGIVVVAVG